MSDTIPQNTPPIAQPRYTVDIAQVEAFSKVWNAGGILVRLDDISKRFARDFANVVLRSFVEDMKAKALANIEKKKKALIVEGL